MFIVKPLKNILDTARELGATDFVRYVELSGLEKEWVREGVYKCHIIFNLYIILFIHWYRRHLHYLHHRTKLSHR